MAFRCGQDCARSLPGANPSVFDRRDRSHNGMPAASSQLILAHLLELTAKNSDRLTDE